MDSPLRRALCDGKQRFSGSLLARKKARTERKATGQPHYAYHCAYCNGWHVTASKLLAGLKPKPEHT